MRFYEVVLIIKQDVSSTDVDKIIDSLTSVIKTIKGNVIKNEYWGLRSLAYPINNNTKGHYSLLGISVDDQFVDGLKEFERRIKLNEDIIRFSIMKVQAISLEPSIILQTTKIFDKSEQTINVTT